MPRHHRPTLTIALLAAAVTGLTGCTTTPATPTSPTGTSVEVATPAAAIPTPAVVAPATSESGAIRDANSSLVGYYTASFQNGHAEGTRLELVTPWVTGAALQNERALATYLQQKHYRLDGAPTGWNLNPSRSTATRTKNANGIVNPFGSVQLVGCATSTNHPVGDGAPAWTKGQQFARAWTVLFDGTQRRWRVSAAVELTSKESKALACP